jgi:hypothetical protein
MTNRKLKMYDELQRKTKNKEEQLISKINSRNYNKGKSFKSHDLFIDDEDFLV